MVLLKQPDGVQSQHRQKKERIATRLSEWTVEEDPADRHGIGPFSCPGNRDTLWQQLRCRARYRFSERSHLGCSNIECLDNRQDALGCRLRKVLLIKNPAIDLTDSP